MLAASAFSPSIAPSSSKALKPSSKTLKPFLSRTSYSSAATASEASRGAASATRMVSMPAIKPFYFLFFLCSGNFVLLPLVSSPARLSTLDGGAASIPSDPSPLMNQVRTMLSYADDRNAKISIIKSILKKKQDHALPPDVPRDLILEAKVRFGNEKISNTFRSDPRPTDVARDAASSLGSPHFIANAAEIRHTQILNGNETLIHSDLRPPASDFVRSVPSPSIEASAVEIHHTQILNAEKELGIILSDLEIAGLKASEVLKSSNIKDSTDPTLRAAAWSSLFSHQVGRARDLKFHNQPSKDPDHDIEFDEEDSIEAVQNWGNSLVGYFIGNNPPTHDIKLCLEKAWRISDLEIIPMAEGFFLFKFIAYDIGQRILDEGSWFVYGHPLILKRWSEDITMCRQNLESIPIWVRLPNLNFCFRSNSALSEIASVIGNPICMDHATATGTRYAFTRVCVEIAVDAKLPSELRMKYKEKIIFQKVEYAWRPNPCKTCSTFNHGDKFCPLKIDTSKPKRVWVPKKKQVAAPTSDMKILMKRNFIQKRYGFLKMLFQMTH